MRAGGINNHRVRIGHQFHCLARSLIWQAKNRNIRRVQQFCPRIFILALGRINRQQLKIVAPRKPVADLQTCCSGFAIDENCWFHNILPEKKTGASFPKRL